MNGRDDLLLVEMRKGEFKALLKEVLVELLADKMTRHLKVLLD